MRNIILKISAISLFLSTYSLYPQSDIASFEAYNKGVEYLSAEDYNLAIEQFKQSISIKPDLASAYYNLAVSYFSIKEYKKALENLKCYSTYNHLSTNSYLKALCYQNLRANDTALIFFKQAVKQEENADNALMKLFEIYYEYGYTDSALFCCNKYIIRNSSVAKGYYNKGVLLMKQNKIKEAKEDFLMANSLNKENAQIMTQLALAHYYLEEIKEATELLQQVVEENPEYIDAYNLLGLTYIKDFKYNKALQIFTKGIEKNNQVLALYNNRAITYFKLEHFDKALADFDYLISVDTNYSNALFNRAKVKNKLYDYSGACEDLHSAFRQGELKAEPLLKFCN